MSSVAKLLVKLFEKRYILLNGGVASLSYDINANY
jgi:hypothetical protein